jgi:hypothetical protein
LRCNGPAKSGNLLEEKEAASLALCHFHYEPLHRFNPRFAGRDRQNDEIWQAELGTMRLAGDDFAIGQDLFQKAGLAKIGGCDTI